LEQLVACTSVDDRGTALATIGATLGEIQQEIERLIQPTAVLRKIIEGNVTGLPAHADGSLVKMDLEDEHLLPGEGSEFECLRNVRFSLIPAEH